jgi:hypothetical protein
MFVILILAVGERVPFFRRWRALPKTPVRAGAHNPGICGFDSRTLFQGDVSMPRKDKSAHAAYVRDKYASDPDYRNKQLERVKQQKLKVKEYIRSKKAGGCIACGEKETCCLVFHHPDPSVKEVSVSRAEGYGMERARKEIEKCVVLCMNCHNKHHAGILDISRFNSGTLIH